MSTKPDPEHLIDDLLGDHWEHPVTEGMPPFYWREPATRFCWGELRGQTFRVNQHELLRDHDRIAKSS